MMKRVLRITSHSARARYLATVTNAGWTPRTDIPSPYASGPTHMVYLDPKRGKVVVVETSHKRFDVFAIGDAPVFATDAGAEAAFMATLRRTAKVNGSVRVVGLPSGTLKAAYDAAETDPMEANERLKDFE